MIKKIFRWIFKNELKSLEENVSILDGLKSEMHVEIQKAQRITSEFDIGVDVDVQRGGRGDSWAVVCLEGKTSNYVRFVNLEYKDVREIQHFLNNYAKHSKRQIIDSPRGMGFDRGSIYRN